MKLIHCLTLVGVAGLVLAVGALRADGKTGADGAEVTTSYFANGQVQSEIQYKAGRKDGLCQRFLSNGNKESEGRYSNGRMEGEWTFWNPDGSVDLQRSGTYSAGERLR